uniref:O-antigen ligase family protein n=1 Tax=Chromohalobacter sp. 48-RD10 TaxID=2994063 RepID=UPI0024682848
PIARFFLVIIIYSMCVSYWSISFDWYVFIVEMVKLVSLFLLFSMLSTLDNKDRDKLIRLSLGFVLVNILSFNFGPDARLQGFFIHANHFAYFCVVLTAYVVLFFNSREKNLALMLLSVAILASKSSGGLIVFLYVIFGAYATYYSFSIKSMLWGVAIAFLITLIAYLFGVTESLVWKVSEFDVSNIREKADKMSFGSDGSLAWRASYGLAIINNLLDGSLANQLFGEGLGSQVEGSYVYDFMKKDPHNDYVRLLIERGGVGFLVVIFSFLFYMLKVRYSLFLIGIIAIPMLSGNVIVSFPYLFLYGVLVSRAYQTNEGELV